MIRSAFFDAQPNGDFRDIGVMTAGSITGPTTLPINEIALAANALEMRVVHIGPHNIPGMPYRPRKWHSVRGLSDDELVDLYSHTQWVSGLCHIRGMKTIAIEGLLCGARPIVFNHSNMHALFSCHAVYVPECSGEKLIALLVEVLKYELEPMSALERQTVLERFSQEKLHA